jgi:hypothetical protein
MFSVADVRRISFVGKLSSEISHSLDVVLITFLKDLAQSKEWVYRLFAWLEPKTLAKTLYAMFSRQIPR